MFEVTGKYATAKIFASICEAEAVNQIIQVCNQPLARGSRVRIMPDVHAGKGCTIGTTMTITDRVVPAMVGVDIGCGMLTMSIGKIDPNPDWLKRFDDAVHKVIPSGTSIRDKAHQLAKQARIKELRCIKSGINEDRAKYSIGTLGGGNHFIELDRGQDGEIYIVIHSGSRNLGKQVAEHYQKLAIEQCRGKSKQAIIAELKLAGRTADIQTALQSAVRVPDDLAYLQGQYFDDYMFDMEIAQQYADLNRKAILAEIVAAMGLPYKAGFVTVHNYIDIDKKILRKGAVSAEQDEMLLIPINMRDGSLICRGKGNEDYNLSAPHGAGRLMSRSHAKTVLNLEEFKEQMSGVYSSTVGAGTIDEAPMAYKPISDIVDNIRDTVEIVEHIIPVYNFKAA